MNSSAIDEFLLIFLVAAKAKGVSTFKNLSELNKKESPRLELATNLLNQIGVKISRDLDKNKNFWKSKVKIKRQLYY